MFSPYTLGIVKLCEGPPKHYVGLIKINTSRIDAQPNIEQSQALQQGRGFTFLQELKQNESLRLG